MKHASWPSFLCTGCGAFIVLYVTAILSKHFFSFLPVQCVKHIQVAYSLHEGSLATVSAGLNGTIQTGVMCQDYSRHEKSSVRKKKHIECKLNKSTTIFHSHVI